MKKQNSLNLIILMLSTLLMPIRAYGYSEAEQSVLTDVQPAVAIEKSTSSKESGSVNPETGVLQEGLSSIFNLQTNGSDEDYDFIVTSKIMTEGGEVSGYGNNGSLLFGHILSMPTSAAIEDAKSGGNNNKNVIVYPVTAAITNPMSVEFQNNYGIHGDCYVVKVNGEKEGTLTHTVGQNPISGTYNIGQDQAGSYQSIVTFSAVSK